LEAPVPSFRWYAVFASALFVACGGGSDGGGGPSVGSVAVNAGDDQVAAAGAVLPESLSVIVRDDAGAPLPGVTVTWAVTAGGGTVSPLTYVSDAGGISRTRRTLGPNAGTQTARATVSGETPVTFEAVAQIQGAVNIANATTGLLADTVDAVKAESLTVTVTDQTATPVEGVNVVWASTTGVVSGGTVATNASGQSKVRFTYGTAAGTQTATATVTGLVGSPVTITFTASAGNPVAIVKTAGDNSTAAPSGQATYTVQARDRHANPKSGVTVEWDVITGGGSIAPPENTTAANGNASATHTLGATSGSNIATATAPAVTGTPQQTFTSTALWTINVNNNNTFSPTSRTIAVGDSVRFAWQGTTSVPHNVTFTGTGSPANIPDRTSGNVSRTFAAAGTINFQCTNHPATMNGTVTVNP
jgi:plastocyanin